MKRYRIENGIPVLPPQNAVLKDGSVISNFAKRIELDADFAATHGYYPIVEPASASALHEAEDALPDFHLQNGCWIREPHKKRTR